MLRFVTDLGDSAFLVPASALLLAYCIHVKATRTAAIWAATLALCAGLTLLLKVAFEACGGGFGALHLRSPSGHVSLSATFYGCSALMISAGKDGWVRAAWLTATGLLLVAIGASRILLEAHTVSEVMVGGLVGLLCLACFALAERGCGTMPLHWPPLLAGLVAIALVTHGLHVNVEGAIERLARLLSLAVCG